MGGVPREVSPTGLLQIEDCLDADGGVLFPPGTTLPALIDRNVAAVGDAIAYRYLDHTGTGGTRTIELTWRALGARLLAVGARIQQHASGGDRVAILAPQGLDFVIGFFAAIKSGTVAVPLFAPELPGHAERLETALRDAQPSVVLTTTAALDVVQAALAALTGLRQPHIVIIDAVPDSVGEAFHPVHLDVDDVSHLQYTGGATRPPVGVEITHRAAGFNLLQMILSIDMLDRNTHGVSWLPLYHDMGLSMLGFPVVYGGHSTLMSPTAFIRRPLRWIEALSAGVREGRVVTAAPNFAYEWAALRGLPAPGADIDLSNVVMIVGSEPVSIDAIHSFSAAFAGYGLPTTAFKPSYGIAEATLFVSTIAPDAEPTVIHLDRRQLGSGQAVPVAPGASGAIPQVSCGQVSRSQWALIVDPDTGDELSDGRVGEIWLQGDNVGRGYWGRPEETRRSFGARVGAVLPSGTHSSGASVDGTWLRTGDLGFYLDGELYVTGRRDDLIVLDGRSHYPQDIEATVADATPIVRRGYVAAVIVPSPEGSGEDLVIIAERAAGTARMDPAPALDAIRAAVADVHGIVAADVRLVPAGAIPRTTSGKLARWACRRQWTADRTGS
ncbi:MAG TPA: fatty acyl-AMP ligase [Mycobacterium sp.]|nr:fatty acyl-AMP ligase [Mycobacterium sp.]